jgi:hypothetical protein
MKRFFFGVIVRISEQPEIVGIHLIEVTQLLVADHFHRFLPQRRGRLGFRLASKEPNQVSFVQFAQQKIDVLVQRFEFPDEMELHLTRKAKVEDLPPMDVQPSLAVSPLADDESDEFGGSPRRRPFPKDWGFCELCLR